MIMKRQIFLAFFLISVAISAQYRFGDINIDFGQKTQKKSGNIMRIAGQLDNYIYTLSRTKKEFFLQTFDAKSKALVSSNPIILNRANELEDFVILGEKLFLMESFYNQASRNHHFIAREIQNNKIVKSTLLLTGPLGPDLTRGRFFFRISDDGSKYLVTYVNKNFRDSSLTYDVVLVNENLKKIFTDTNRITSEQKRVWPFKFSDTRFNENGDIVFALIENYRDRHEKTKYNKATIYSYQANNNFNRKELKIELQGNYLEDCTVIPTKNNKLHIAGFYSKLEKSGRRNWDIEGIYDVVIDYKNGEVVNKSFNPFPYQIKEQIIGKRKAEKGKGLYYEWYQNIAFIERDNGGIFVLSEFNVKGEPSRFLWWRIYVYHSQHTIVTALNPDGSLHWSNLIPKIQSESIDITGTPIIPRSLYRRISLVPVPLLQLGTGEEFLSVFPIYKNGRLTVLYNDDIANIGKMNVGDLESVIGIKDMMTTAYIFDEETGERKRIDQIGSIVLKPLINKRISNDRYLIYGGNRKVNALGELVIKD